MRDLGLLGLWRLVSYYDEDAGGVVSEGPLGSQRGARMPSMMRVQLSLPCPSSIARR